MQSLSLIHLELPKRFSDIYEQLHITTFGIGQVQAPSSLATLKASGQD